MLFLILLFSLVAVITIFYKIANRIKERRLKRKLEFVRVLQNHIPIEVLRITSYFSLSELRFISQIHCRIKPASIIIDDQQDTEFILRVGESGHEVFIKSSSWKVETIVDQIKLVRSNKFPNGFRSWLVIQGEIRTFIENILARDEESKFIELKRIRDPDFDKLDLYSRLATEFESNMQHPLYDGEFQWWIEQRLKRIKIEKLYPTRAYAQRQLKKL